MPLLQKRHVLTLALRVIACLREREEGMGPHPRAAIYAGLRKDRVCAREGQLLQRNCFARDVAKLTKRRVIGTKTIALFG